MMISAEQQVWKQSLMASLLSMAEEAPRIKLYNPQYHTTARVGGGAGFRCVFQP